MMLMMLTVSTREYEYDDDNAYTCVYAVCTYVYAVSGVGGYLMWR